MPVSLMPPVAADDGALWPVAGDAMITEARSLGSALEPAVVVMSSGS